MPYTGTLPSAILAAGAQLPAAWTQQVGGAITALGTSWTSYTPALTAATTNPTLGTGSSQTGQYLQVGKFVVGYFNITFGSSGTAAGTGNYFVSLPVVARNLISAPIGIANTLQGTAWGDQKLYIQTTTTVQLVYAATWPNGTLTNVSATTPSAWSTSHQIRGFFTYEAA